MVPSFDAVTLQTTPLCNIKCRYCYLGHPQSKPTAFDYMPVALVKRVFTNLVEYHNSHEIDTGINVTFHGGEPLLLGHDFFKESLDFIHDLSEKSGTPFTKSIQTNLTLLDQNFCSIFKEHNVSIGTSLDGPADLHDKHRVSKHGGTHAKVMEKIELARLNGLDVGAICTVTKDKLTEAKRIYDFFRENGIGCKTNSLFMQGEAVVNWQDFRASLMEFGHFFCELFDLWYDNPPELSIENLVEVMLLVIKGREYGGDCSSINCAHRQFTVTHNGDCTPCGRTVNVSEFALGNVWESNFFMIANSPAFQHLSTRIPDSIDKCSKCDLKTVCYSGCMYDAYLEHGTIFAPGGDCKAFRYMYNHVHDRILTDVQNHSITSRS